MEPLQIASASYFSAALMAAARLGVADLLHQGPRSADELAEATGAHAPALRSVLRLLATAGIFRQLDDGSFENTKDSEPLRTDHPRSVRHFCILAGSEYYRSFGEIMHTVRTGEPAFQHVYGSSIYEYMDRNPEAGAVYDRAMEDLARPVGDAVAGTVDFGGVRSVVDVGGGSGALLKKILGAHAGLHGVCFDREDVCLRARRQLAEGEGAGLRDRLTFVGGDFFSGVPRGADLYILKNVLHNWNDESCLGILGSVRAALDEGRAGPPQRLLVIEPLLHDGRLTMPRPMSELFQMVICEEGTTARTEDEFRELLRRASFRVSSVKPLQTGHVVIESVAALSPEGEGGEPEGRGVFRPDPYPGREEVESGVAGGGAGGPVSPGV